MALSDVNVIIDLVKPIGSVGFGIPLILEENASKAVEYTECDSLADVVAAGYTETTKVYKTATLMLMQNNAPKKIAVCSTTGTTVSWLTDVANTAKDWRDLVVVAGGTDEIDVASIMTSMETLGEEGIHKLFFASLELNDETVFNVNEIERTVLFYCNSTEEFPVPVAALVGATAGKTAGSITYKNMILKGISPQSLTSIQVENIHDKGGITFVTKAGDNVTSEGKVAGGDFIDVIDGNDFVISNIAYKVQKTLNSLDKVAYTNNGITVIENAVIDVLREAYINGIIAENEDGTPAYTVNFARREDTTEADRAERKYTGGQFAYYLAGAIHTVDPIRGEVRF